MGKKLIQFLRRDQVALSSPRSVLSSSSASDDDASHASSSSLAPSASSSPSRSSTTSPPRSAQHLLPTRLGGGNLIASLAKPDGGSGKVYSLALAGGDVLYAGTDSGTVRVWRGRRDLGGFRTGSGLVKAVVIAGDGRVFTGHQDGKIRVWRRHPEPEDDGSSTRVRHPRVGSLPALGDYLASSVNPACYVAGPRSGRRRSVWNRHADAVSCLSLDAGAGLLYSASWDRTVKAWRLADSRCLDSVPAHDDAVNAVAALGFAPLVLTGSADGAVKLWRREILTDKHQKGGKVNHVLDRVLQRSEAAVTAIAVSTEARAAYVGSSDGLVACWRWVHDDEPVPGGVLVAGHGGGVMCLAVCGPLVVSGAADGTICAWRRDGAKEHVKLAVLAAHAGPIKCVAVARDEEEGDERRFVVYSGGLDGSVKVWRLSDDDHARPDKDYSITGGCWNRAIFFIADIPIPQRKRVSPSRRCRLR